MKLRVEVEIEEPGDKSRVVYAHAEAFHHRDPDEAQGLELEMQLATDDKGKMIDDALLPAGFWREVEEHIWREYYRSSWPLPHGNLAAYFPQESEMLLELQDQHV